MSLNKFRSYQSAVDKRISEELNVNNKCLVKMFCGTGKSLIMKKCKAVRNKKCVVYVFPSLALIDQYNTDYLTDVPNECILKVSSENETESTTDPALIVSFLKINKKNNKIICVTYQSYKTLLDNLGTNKINVCVFDEAHHAVGETYQQLIFNNDICEKQIFFTATPKNANGIIMYDRQEPESSMCGKLVYDYTYLDGTAQDYLNPFQIQIDMFTENTNVSLYETICRTVISSGNNRVLTFHSDVNTESSTSVKNFVNEPSFIQCFNKIVRTEFPEKKDYYNKITMIGLSSNAKPQDRKQILVDFDKTSSTEIYVISSCRTIGEGIDTKRANMCVFIDPKSSFVAIIQNIGRIVRKTEVLMTNSTILIPCWIDKDKYLDCNGDKEKCDEIIRQDINKGGNFNGILNVLSALRQEDEDIYDICLHYPDTYSPQEIKSNLEKNGYEIIEPQGEGGLLENLEYIIDAELDNEEFEDCDTDEDLILQIAENHNVCVEVHTNSLENPVETYNSKCTTGEIVRIYKSTDEQSDETMYCPIVKKCGKKRNKDRISQLQNRKKRTNVNVHTNPDVKVLWNISNNFDITKDICTCILECEIVYTWEDTLKTVKKFIDDNKKKPVSCSKNKDEKILGCWIQTQQTNYKKNIQSMKSEDRKNKWNDFIETYKEYVMTLDEIWIDTLNSLKIFIDNNKKRPSGDSTNDNEKRLGGWIQTQQTNYKKNIQSMKTEERKNIWCEFMETYKTYMMTFDEIWIDTFNELKKFIDNNKKRPSKESTNNDEKRLGAWIQAQQNNYKKNKESMKTKERKNIWSEFIETYKEYFISDDEKWNDTFNEVKNFIDDNKKRPSCDSTNDNEKRLEQWISQQQNNYKKNKKSMISEERKNIWDEFKAEYNYLFNDNDDDISVTSDISIVDEPLIKSIVVKKKSMDLSKPKPSKDKDKNKEKSEERKRRITSEISQLHQRYKTLNSRNLNIEFNDNLGLWDNYHKISEENEKSFPEEEIPRNCIIAELNKIKTKREKIVVDMGCGKGQINDHFKNDNRFRFINYDHISSNNQIISCDISELPLEDDSVDICILSLAMWGSNCDTYINEANRVLESNGQLYIIEPTKRWSHKDDDGNIVLGEEGAKLRKLIEDNGFQVTCSTIKKFCMFVCVKVN